MTAPFIHLHLHSAYSLSEGAIQVSRVKDLCLAAKMPAVAVTDTNNLFGALEVSTTLAGAGVQPIIGIQQTFTAADFGLPLARGERPPSLVLLAQNKTGYQNLLKLTSDAFLDSADEDIACATLDRLAGGTEGLICLSGGYDGPINRLLRENRASEAQAALERLIRLFPDRLYLELQRHAERTDAEAALLDLAYSFDIPIVATNEPYFPTPDDHEAHDALMCIADGAYVHQDDRRRVTPDHYFKTSAEMASLFSDLPEALKKKTKTQWIKVSDR